MHDSSLTQPRALAAWADLVVVGISHRQAGVEIREQLALSEKQIPEALERLCRDGGLSGLVILSTCNRMECYASAADAEAAERFLRAFYVDRCANSDRHLFAHRGPEAARHLFRVASGLDSIVVGERQIAGQVKTAYQQAQAAGRTDKLLNKAFQSALGAGKAVRTRTTIADGISSCGGAAVAMAETVLPRETQGRRIMLVGAGKMAEAAAQHLLERSGTELTIANRDVAHALTLAAQYGARAVSLDEGMLAIHTMDVIIVSTGCPHYLVTQDRLADLTARRGGRPLVIIDLGVPRNVDPAVGDMPGVFLYNIDDLEAVIAETLSRRHGEIQAAERIIDTLLADFCSAMATEPAPRKAPVPAGTC